MQRSMFNASNGLRTPARSRAINVLYFQSTTNSRGEGRYPSSKAKCVGRYVASKAKSVAIYGFKSQRYGSSEFAAGSSPLAAAVRGLQLSTVRLQVPSNPARVGAKSMRINSSRTLLPTATIYVQCLQGITNSGAFPRDQFQPPNPQKLRRSRLDG